MSKSMGGAGAGAINFDITSRDSWSTNLYDEL